MDTQGEKVTAPAFPAMRDNTTNPSRRKKRILLVDDEAAFTMILKLCLPGLDVCAENDPFKATETARRFKPDIMFLDLIMPGVDGGFVAAQFKEDPELAKLPIVFLSGVLRAKETGARQTFNGHDFLAKPVSRDQIIACVEKHLGTS